MAIDLIARLSLQDRFTDRLRRATRQMDATGKRTRSLTESTTKLTNALAGIAGVGVTAGLVAISKSIVTIGIEFDTQMSKVAAISGATGDSLANMRDLAKDLGRTTVFTATQAAEGMEYLALAGWKSEAIIKAMPGMLNLAAAGALDIGRAADITSDTMQAFGMSAELATHAADVFAYAQANANTNVEQMGEAMKYAAPVANAFGWQLEETSAAMMTVANSGLKGSIAGQAWASSVARLAAPTKRMKTVMKDLGMEFFNAEGKMKSLPDVLAELEKGTAKLTQKERSAVITKMFGAEAYKHWAILLEGGSDSLRKMTNELENSDGAAEKMAGTMLDNLGGSLNQLTSALQGAAIEIYEVFEPALRKMVDRSTAVVTKLTPMAKAFAQMLAPLKPIAKVLGTFLIALAGVAGAVLTFKLIGMAVAFLASPIGLIAAGITALAYGFKFAYEQAGKFKEYIENIINAAKMPGNKTMNILSAIGFKASALNMILNFTDKIKGAMSAFKLPGNKAANVLSALGFDAGQLQKFIEFTSTVKQNFAEFKSYLAAKFEEIKPGLMSLLDTFKRAGSIIMSALGSAWSFLQPVFGALQTAFQVVGDVATIAFNNIIVPAVGFLIRMFQVAWAVVGPILKLIGEAIGLAFGVLKVVWNTILKPVAKFLTGVFKLALEALNPAIDTLKSSFELIGGAISKVADIFGNFKEAISNFKMPAWVTSAGDAISNGLSRLASGGKPKTDGSHFHGLNRVPYDGYVATLHRGERVQTKQEVDRGQGGGGVSVSFAGANFTVRQESDIDAIANALITKIIAAGQGGA